MSDKLNKNITNRQFLFGDADNDGVKNVDDKFPLDPKRDDTVEETLLSNEIKDIKSYAFKFESDTEKVKKKLESLGFPVRSRIKGAYSIINKLKRKYLSQLEDIGGVAVIVETEQQAYSVAEFIRKNFDVVNFEDYFINPKDKYYRALHLTIKIDNLPVEIQVKTKKEQEVHLKAHSIYKKGKLTVEKKEKFAKMVR